MVRKAGPSFLSTSGNAEASTFGISNEVVYKWKTAQLQFNVAAVPINTTTVTRFATGSSRSDYSILERKATPTTYASYVAGLCFDHCVTERFFWFVGAGWERNLPTGLEGRLKGSGGLGRVWVAESRTKFSTDLGLGYTHENPVFRRAGFKSSFATWMEPRRQVRAEDRRHVGLRQRAGLHRQPLRGQGLHRRVEERPFQQPEQPFRAEGRRGRHLPEHAGLGGH